MASRGLRASEQTGGTPESKSTKSSIKPTWMVSIVCSQGYHQWGQIRDTLETGYKKSIYMKNPDSASQEPNRYRGL